MLWNVEGQTFSGDVFYLSLSDVLCFWCYSAVLWNVTVYFVTIVNASFCIAMDSPMAFCSKHSLTGIIYNLCRQNGCPWGQCKTRCTNHSLKRCDNSFHSYIWHFLDKWVSLCGPEAIECIVLLKHWKNRDLNLQIPMHSLQQSLLLCCVDFSMDHIAVM